MLMIAGEIAVTSPGNVFGIVDILCEHYGVQAYDLQSIDANHHNDKKWAAFKEDFDRRSNGKTTHLWDNIIGVIGRQCDKFAVYYMWDKRDHLIETPVVYVELQDEDSALAFTLKLTEFD